MNVQDFFKTHDGKELMDTPIVFELMGEPRESEIENTKYGPRYKVPLKHFATQKDAIFLMSEEQIQRILSNTTKDGKITWQAKRGDLLEMKKVSPKTPGGNPFWKASYHDPSSPIIEPGAAATPGTQMPSSEPKWDGTPRQSNFRNQLLDAACALVSASSSPKLTDELKVAAVEMVWWARTEGEAMEASDRM